MYWLLKSPSSVKIPGSASILRSVFEAVKAGQFGVDDDGIELNASQVWGNLRLITCIFYDGVDNIGIRKGQN